MSMKKKKKTSPFRPYLPVIGLLLAVCFGIISWVLAPGFLQWTVDNVAGITGREFSYQTMRLMFAGVIFFGFVMVASIIVSFASPKQKEQVSVNDLKAEKAMMDQEKKDRKRRLKEMRKNSRNG